MMRVGKPLVLLHGEIKSPPFSLEARKWAGFLLRKLQQGHALNMPHSRPMPNVGPKCHELRIEDVQKRASWRIMYRIDSDAVVIAEIWSKKTQKTPADVIERCNRRFSRYDRDRRLP